MSVTRRLRALLQQPHLLEIPGCYDAFSALLVSRAGFPAAYVSGFGVSASALGLPDRGLMSFREILDRVAAIAAAVEIPVIADADTGYGSPLNVYRTVREYARRGVAGIQLEDQEWPKRCGHIEGQQVLPLEDAVAKIRAAVDARAEQDIVIVARTDARAALGLEAAIERCQAFAAAGADLIFCEAPRSRGEMEQVCRRVTAPLLANVVEGGKTPLLSRDDLEALGYRVAIYPVTLLFAAADGMARHLAARREGAAFPRWNDPQAFAAVKEVLGFDTLARREETYRGQ
jgi:carboxyvinyl-carboxyphosphonate phosphorylmutase